MLEIDPKLGTVLGNTDVIKLYFFYWFGLLGERVFLVLYIYVA